METPCPACTIPLTEPIGAVATLSSVVLFACGHAFHQLCAAEGACPICLHERVGPLTTMSADVLQAALSDQPQPATPGGLPVTLAPTR